MKLAIVIPWFGRELKGGAEQQAWQIAARLAQRKHFVEVLTTCCRSHQDDWSTNHFPAGQSQTAEGFIIRRFPVDLRNRAAFDSVCSHLLRQPAETFKPGISPVPPGDAQIFVDELIKSSALQSFLEEKKAAFDAFIFLPYLYGPIIHGVAAVGDRACLQPCLHDEPYAYLPQVADAFYRAGKLFFNSEGEAELALRIFGPAIATKSIIVGEGVESDPVPDSNGNGNDGTSAERFVLYLGRKEPGKNADMLVRAFSRFRLARPNSDLRLVLAGHGKIELNGGSNHILDLGLVPDEKKERLLASCVALAQPSVNESFSRAMMEAWLHGKPVAVHSDCLATSIAARKANGGWLAGSEKEWAALFAEIERSSPAHLSKMGANGKRYAEVAANWEKVLDRYEKSFPQPSRHERGFSSSAAPCEIHQFLPSLSHGDAVSNHALQIRDCLRHHGCRSEIFVRFVDPRVQHECRIYSPELLHSSTAIIYHHSIGTEITPQVVAFRGPKCLIYHNITPAEFVEPYRPQFAQILRAGRDELRQLAPHFALSYGVSEYNASELRNYGFSNPGVLPLPVDPGRWAFSPDERLMNTLQDGRTNVLFVGRIAPNKKQDDLVAAFYYYRALDPSARLILAGKAEQGDPYAAHLQQVIARHGLKDCIIMPGSVTNAELAAYYRTTHLFWSMSEHEGFCVPLIEAMWFDVPVFAYRSSAIPETLGEARFLFTDKSDLRQLAATAYLLRSDSALREAVIQQQRRRRENYLPEKMESMIHSLVKKLVRGKPARGARVAGRG